MEGVLWPSPLSLHFMHQLFPCMFQEPLGTTLESEEVLCWELMCAQAVQLGPMVLALGLQCAYYAVQELSHPPHLTLHAPVVWWGIIALERGYQAVLHATLAHLVLD